MQPRKTRKIRIGNLVIGGDSPIAVQSMAATQTQDLDATARQIEVLEKAKAEADEDIGDDFESFEEKISRQYLVC